MMFSQGRRGTVAASQVRLSQGSLFSPCSEHQEYPLSRPWPCSYGLAASLFVLMSDSIQVSRIPPVVPFLTIP